MSPKRGISLDDWPNPYGGRFNDEGTLQLSIPGVQGATGVGTVAMAIDTVRYYPMVVDHPIQVDQLSVEVTAAGGASTVGRLGIYHADTDFQPTTLVVDAGTVLVDSTGPKHLAVSPAEVLLPGRYVMAFNSDAAPSLRALRTVHAMWGGISDTLGASLLVFQLQATQTFAAFPDPGTQYTAATVSSTGLSFVMFLRVSAL